MKIEVVNITTGQLLGSFYNEKDAEEWASRWCRGEASVGNKDDHPVGQAWVLDWTNVMGARVLEVQDQVLANFRLL